MLLFNAAFHSLIVSIAHRTLSSAQQTSVLCLCRSRFRLARSVFSYGECKCLCGHPSQVKKPPRPTAKKPISLLRRTLARPGLAVLLTESKPSGAAAAAAAQHRHTWSEWTTLTGDDDSDGDGAGDVDKRCSVHSGQAQQADAARSRQEMLTQSQTQI